MTIQTGTLDELAGVTVGSGNVWARDGHGSGLSVALALPDDATCVLGIGASVDLLDHRCTLERIEPGAGGRSYTLHFVVEPIDRDLVGDHDDTALASSTATPAPAVTPPAPTSPGSAAATPSSTIVLSAPTVPDPARGLRSATPAALGALGVLGGLGTGDEGTVEVPWERTDHEDWVTIDRVPCGPNTRQVWRWQPADGSTDGTIGADRTVAEVSSEVVRWNPDEIHQTWVRAHWRHRHQSVHVSLMGERGADAVAVRVTAPVAVLPGVTDVVARALGSTLLD